jgi:hypothetical protein
MKAIRAGLLALAVWPQMGAAQDLNGTWLTDITGYDGTRFAVSMTLGTAEFAVQITTTVPQGYTYVSGFRGSVFAIAPDQLHLVVTDWDPKIVDNIAQARPPDSTYTILEITADRLVLRDNLCAATSASVDGCTNSYRRAA